MNRGPRWRVVIVDDHERSRVVLRAAIWSAGGEVTAEAPRGADAQAAVERGKADIAIVAVGLPDGDGVDVAAALIADAGCPVVLLTSRTDEALVRRASEVGVMAYLLKPLRPAELAPALDIAIARFRESRELRRALEERKLVERAKGALMRRLGLEEEEAFARLRRAAMDSRRPMADVARAVLVSESMLPGMPRKQAASSPREP